MTIEIYPSALEGTPVEVHDWAGTFADFLDQHAEGWREKGDIQPLTVTVNDAHFPVGLWDTHELYSSDKVKVVIQTQFGGMFSGVGAIIGVVLGLAFAFLMPRGGKQQERHATPQGRRLDAVSAKANQAKLGDVVPELAGRFRRLPDYLTPPRRFFASPREQWLEFHACVGPGEYQIEPEDVRVGDTPFGELGDDASFDIYSPGADLSGTDTHEHWHTVAEVGGTSSGSAGLEMTTEPANRTNVDPTTYTFDGSTITRSEGEFPVAWGAGTIITLSVEREQTYEVSAMGVGVPNVFDGDFAHLMPFSGGFVNVAEGSVALPAGRYIASAVSLDAQGQGTMQLSVPGEGDDPPEPVDFVPAGDHDIMFYLDPREITLSSVDEDEITVSGVSFPQYTAPAVIAFSGGTSFGEWSNHIVATPGNEE